MTKNTHRIQLLNKHQIEELYGIPKFTKEEQVYFFELSDTERKIIESHYKTLKTKTAFVLQLGYFKATHKFYDEVVFNSHRSDNYYILKNILGEGDVKLSSKLGYDTKVEQQKRIVSMTGFSFWRYTNQTAVEQHLLLLLRTHANPLDALRELLVFLENKKIILPSYRNLQDLFSSCITLENKRLEVILEGLPKQIKNELNNVINSENVIADLTDIKADQKGFQLMFVNQAVEAAAQMSELYAFAQKFLPKLGIANNCIGYYAELADQLTSSRIRMLRNTQQWLYVLCLINEKYEQCMNNLIISFIYHFRSLDKASKEYANAEEIKYNALAQETYPKVSALLRLIPSDVITPDMPYEKFLEAAYKLLPENEYTKMADVIDGKAFDKEVSKWDFIEEKSRTIASYLRPLILNVEFSHSWDNSVLMQLISILKNHYNKKKTPGKLKIHDGLGITVPSNISSYLKPDENGCYQSTRFEFYVYQKLYLALDSGTLSCPESISYKSLKDDLVSDEVLDRAEEISKQHGYPKILTFCDQRLVDLEEKAHSAWLKTNENITNGENTGIRIEDPDSNNKHPWTLTYDAHEREYQDAFFSGAQKIEIANLLTFIANKTNLWEQFTHIKPRYSKQKADQQSLLACIMADAFGFGVQKMAEICDLNHHTLNSTHTNFIRLATLRAANDRISDFILSLPIFRVWDIEPGKIISDYDGSKFRVNKKTIQARHSKKYFGDSPGISVVSLMANHVPINSKVIGCNEHESQFAFDLVYHNTSNIPVDMLTGDNHTINQMNFVALDVIDTDFIPGFKNIREQTKSLYCTRDPSLYKGLITPKGQVDLKLIKSQKREITRVLLSLILQHNTQATIIRKLSSHKRNLRLKTALWEYNKIFKSIHVLNLIDDESLRHKIRRARNRTEAYHQLQRMIRKVHSGVFHGKKVVDNGIYNQASRLVANCSIAYNAILLSNVYEDLVVKFGEERAREIMSHVSPVAWQHINFTGRYKFMAKNKAPDIDVLSEWLASKLTQYFEGR